MEREEKEEDEEEEGKEKDEEYLSLGKGVARAGEI